DCADTLDTVYPGAPETCNGRDDDCDGALDEASAVDARRWYVDGDGDGAGAGAATLACSAPSGSVASSDDCDDADDTSYPGATEIWYDGTDSDCRGDDDYDADADGEYPYSEGGLDCNDLDPTRVRCREAVSCTHPSAATLTTYDPPGASDIQFDANCVAVIPTVISGTDYVYTVTRTGATSIYTGAATYNIGSVAVDPRTGRFAVGYNNVGFLGYSSGSSVPVVATGGVVNGAAWANSFLNQAPASLAVDVDGCIWWPNWVASGRLSCLTSAGVATTVVASAGGYIESVALDSAEELYIAVGSTIYLVNTSTGARTVYTTVTGTVLDMVFDYNDDLYVESGGVITVTTATGSRRTFATVSGQGKLAISPDGALVRIIPIPESAASWQEWTLP
ncbi:MAG: hypothetical protein FJ306_14200, partial [Planctomycetes bacterium]|nr:hypothetical protein [Planctomycetota bacterium]